MTCGLGLAQLGELGGHVRHRAVVLAQLPAGGDRGRVGSVALGGQRPGECLGPGERVVAGVRHGGPAAVLERGDLVGGERRRPPSAPPLLAIQRSAAVAMSS